MSKGKALQSITLAAFLIWLYVDCDRVKSYLKLFEEHLKGPGIMQVQNLNHKPDKAGICGKIIHTEYGSLKIGYNRFLTNNFLYKIIEVESPDKTLRLLTFTPARYSVGDMITAEYLPLSDRKATLEELSCYIPSMLHLPKYATCVVEGIDGIFPY